MRVRAILVGAGQRGWGDILRESGVPGAGDRRAPGDVAGDREAQGEESKDRVQEMDRTGLSPAKKGQRGLQEARQVWEKAIWLSSRSRHPYVGLSRYPKLILDTQAGAIRYSKHAFGYPK